MFCTACAAANPVATGRCRGCGRHLAPASTTRAATNGSVESIGARSRLRRRWLPTLLVAVPLLALLAVVGLVRQAERAELARFYARAEAAAAVGDYETALDAFAAAAGYGDADARRDALAASLAPARDAYDRGVAALGAGRYDEAVALLDPVVARLPGHREAADLLAEARRLLAADLLQRADAASARRDWLAAEAALATLSATQPADRGLADRLARLRRAHAPIAFARDHALFLLGPDGADERLVTGAVPVARPIWSPDRSRIAFVSADGIGGRAPAVLYVVGADGRGLTRLSPNVHPNAVPAWSPDGGRIAYASVAAYDLLAESGRLAVHVVEVATGRDRDVTAGTGRHAVTPSWSPTGDQLAFVSRPTVDAADIPGDAGPSHVAVLDLASGAIADLSGDRLPDVARVLWSPTEERILAFARSRGVGGGASGVTRLVELDPRGGTVAEVATIGDEATAGWSPAWAPDGARYAFLDGPSTVVVRDRDGRETRVVTGGTLSGALSWSPDGSALLLAAAGPSDPSLVVDLAGGTPTTTELAIPYDPDWPTGTPQWSPVALVPSGAVPLPEDAVLGDGPALAPKSAA